MAPARRASPSAVAEQPAVSKGRSAGKVAATDKATEPGRPPTSSGAAGVKTHNARPSAAAQPARTAKKTTKETVSSAVTTSSSPTEKIESADKAEKVDKTDKRKPVPAKASSARNGSAPEDGAGGAVIASSRPAAPAKRAAPKKSPDEAAGPYAGDTRFLAEQRELLEAERTVYESQASDLKAEADSLAQEREPGDVQFDEESGEGGTVTVDRERDLALSAQALAAVEEIDAALARIEDGTYGACERCHQAIPKPRLKALPFARLCVACKSGGLSRR